MSGRGIRRNGEICDGVFEKKTIKGATPAPIPRQPWPKEVEVKTVKRGGKRIDPSKAKGDKS